MTTLFAVYGTLKRGFGNNRILQNGSDFLCEDVIDGYGLKYAGFPVSYPNPGTSIKVEIFETYGDKSTISNLDRLEGVPYMYERKVVTTRGGHNVNLYVGTPSHWDINKMRDCIVEDNLHSWDPRAA